MVAYSWWRKVLQRNPESYILLLDAKNRVVHQKVFCFKNNLIELAFLCPHNVLHLPEIPQMLDFQ